jgi:FkbM family methyltransferase
VARVTDYPRLGRIAKRIIIFASAVTSRRSSQNALSLLETVCAILQGKGSGTGWDISAEAKAALPFLSEGAIIFDVGANRGDWSLELHRRANLKLNFFMFEPQESCQEDLARLPIEHKVIVRAAVGEARGHATLYSPGPGAGNAALYNRRDTAFEQQIFSPVEVPIISLDNFIQENHLNQIDYLKIDVEGHELQVLNGCTESLSRGLIKAISFEFGTGNVNSRTYFRDFWDVLTHYNYAIRRILPGGRCYHLDRYYEDMEYFRGVSNYQAVYDAGCDGQGSPVLHVGFPSREL